MASSEDDKKEKRLSRLQPSVIKLLDCPVCYERLVPPITVCKNGHAVCSACLTELQRCPTCQTAFSPNKNTILDQIIEENIFPCKYADKGCVVEMKLHALQEHELNDCVHRTIICTILTEGKEQCRSHVSLCSFHEHVTLRHVHATQLLDFSLETKRSLVVSADTHAINVLRDAKTPRIVLEVIKLELSSRKFYVTYIHVGTKEEANKSAYELRLSNPRDKCRELKFKSLCIPLGTTAIEDSERCLVLGTSLLPNFTLGDQLTYSVRFETVVAKKWYKKVGRRWTSGLEDKTGSEG